MTGRGRIFRTGSAWKGAFPDGIKATRAKASINRKGEGAAEEAVVGDTMAAAAVAVVTDATNL